MGEVVIKYSRGWLVCWFGQTFGGEDGCSVESARQLGQSVVDLEGQHVVVDGVDDHHPGDNQPQVMVVGFPDNIPADMRGIDVMMVQRIGKGRGGQADYLSVRRDVLIGDDM